jgi:hypothetical protein
MNWSSDIWGQVNAPSPYGLCLCLLVIDNLTNYMWGWFWSRKMTRFRNSNPSSRKSTTCMHGIIILSLPLLMLWNSTQTRFSTFHTYVTRQMCGRLGVGVQFSASYSHHMLGNVERTWRTLRNKAYAMVHKMSVPNPMRPCAVSTVEYLPNIQPRSWSLKWRSDHPLHV